MMTSPEGTATGIAFYGLPNDVDAQRLLTAALDFFAYLGLKPKSASYTIETPEDADGEVLQLKNTSIAGLREALTSGKAQDFSLSLRPAGATQWTCSASFETTCFIADRAIHGDAAMLNCTYYATDRSQREHVFRRLAQQVTRCVQIPYGISYEVDGDLADVSSYAAGGSFQTIYSNESARAWMTQMPPGSANAPREYGQRMRMVYPCNLLGPAHLEQAVDGQSLGHWIGAQPGRGSLEAMERGNTIWTVPPERLEEINQVLGEAGQLIGWQAKKPPPARRRLP